MCKVGVREYYFHGFQICRKGILHVYTRVSKIDEREYCIAAGFPKCTKENIVYYSKVSQRLVGTKSFHPKKDRQVSSIKLSKKVHNFSFFVAREKLNVLLTSCTS
jgi:hypothetical protein